jgi:glycine/D-amino acid oxidase-like deaminating enzyme
MPRSKTGSTEPLTVLTAKRTPADLAGSGWYELLPPPGPAQTLYRTITADWVIVGAGFAGLAAARRLAQLRAGDRIVLIDAQRIGWGAAGRNSGFMIDLPHELNSDDYAGDIEADRRQIRMNREAISFVSEAVEEFGLERFFSLAGKVHGAADDAGLGALGRFTRHLDQLGEPYRTLDAEAMRRLTGTGFWRGGIHTPGAAMIQPAAYVRGLANALRGRVMIFENSPVLRIETGPDHLVHTPAGRVRAPKLILTVNGQIESFGLYERRLMHVFTFASMTRALSEGERRRLGGEPAWGLIPADPLGTTVRRIAEGRIVIRNTFAYEPGMATTAAQIARVGRRHDRSFRARFPMLEGVGMEYRWGGHLCLSWNSVPAFGEVEAGVYTACCQNGLGTVKGTLGGLLIADLAAGSNSPLVHDMLALEPPQKLYPDPFMTIAARSVLWWRQARVGRDL